MKSKFLIVSLALCLMVSGMAQAYDCGCNDVNPCNSCNTCNSKCDLFSGLKNLLKVKPLSLNSCGPCDAVVACAPCEAACVAVAPCEPVAACYTPVACCDPVAACDPVCADTCAPSCFDPCCDRPVLRVAQKTKANVSKFFNGLFGSLKGCNCGVCGGGCNACDPCFAAPIAACDPCAPACYSNAMPMTTPE